MIVKQGKGEKESCMEREKEIYGEKLEECREIGERMQENVTYKEA